MAIPTPSVGQPDLHSYAQFISCGFFNNTSAEEAGAICNQYDNTKVFNCVFAGNTAGDDGGALYNQGSPGEGILTVINSTFSGNHADDQGGAIYNARVLRVINCIVYGNTATNADPEIHKGSDVDVDESDVNGGITCTGCSNNINSDPFFADPDYKNFRLVGGSPCIDTGDKTLLTSAENDTYNVDNDADTTEKAPDRDRTTRIVNSGANEIDMGAYEHHGSETCCADVNHNGTVNIDDLLEVIGSWGPCPGCDEDIAPGPECVGNGTTNIDDLLTVVNAWGPCPHQTGDSNETSMPTSIQDCIDEATRRYTPYTTNWYDFVERCTDALCAQHLIDCD